MQQKKEFVSHAYDKYNLGLRKLKDSIYDSNLNSCWVCFWGLQKQFVNLFFFMFQNLHKLLYDNKKSFVTNPRA